MQTNGAIHSFDRTDVRWDPSPGAHEQTVLVKVCDVDTLRKHWPWIEKRLIWLKQKDRSTEQWLPGHIRQGIIAGFSGQSTIELFFGVADDGAIEGFMITTVISDPYTRLPDSLLVWVLWANKDLIERFLPELEELARQRFLNAVEFFSGREGWLRSKISTKHGFKVKCMVYRKDVK